MEAPTKHPELHAIPEELQELDQWVVWRPELRSGTDEPTKPPFCAGVDVDRIKGPTRRASATDPTTWAPFRVAYITKMRHPGVVGGLGFVFTDADPYCGIDLDHCVDPETGEIAEWALGILEDVGPSYTELSPSGTGLHVIVKAKLPPGSRRKGNIEMYDSERYFTFTGLAPKGTWPTDIRDRQRNVEQLHRKLFRAAEKKSPEFAGHLEILDDEEIIKTIERSKQAETFEALFWRRDLSAYDDDHSAADQALCNILAFFARGDEATIDRLFRRSALMRPKWDERHYGDGRTYGQGTIQKALEDRTEFYSAASRHDANPAHDRDTRDTRDAKTGHPQPKPPDPSRIERTPAIPFPVDAMPPACVALIRECEKAFGSDPALFAMPMLGALASAIGTSRVAHIKRGWQIPASLFLCVVASTGQMKSPSAKPALAPLYDREKKYKAEYLEARDQYERELREYKVLEAEARKDGVAAPPPPIPPTHRRAVTSDTTMEALSALLEENPRGLFNHQDELTGWIGSMDQYKTGGKGADRSNWLKLYDCNPIVVDRKGRLSEPIIVASPFVVLSGGIQPALLPALGSVMEDGLMERFLYAYPVPRIIRFSEYEISDGAERAYEKLYDSLAGLQGGKDANGDVSPKPIPLTFDARRLFAAHVDELAEQAIDPAFPRRLEGVWSKMRGHLGRLALILALCRLAGDPKATEQIEKADVQNAATLLAYFKEHARRVYGEVAEASPKDIFAATITKLLIDHGGEWQSTPTELAEELAARGHGEHAPDWLTRRLKELSQQSGTISIKRSKTGGTRTIKLSLVPQENGVPGVPLVPQGGSPGTPGTPNSDGSSTDNDPSNAQATPSNASVQPDADCNTDDAGLDKNLDAECTHLRVTRDCWICNPDHPRRAEIHRRHDLSEGR